MPGTGVGVPTELIAAIIAALPPTIMATAAWRRSKRLEGPLSQVNNAVNHRSPGQRRLIQVVDEVSHSLGELSKSVRRVEAELERHQAYHQREEETR